LRAQWILDIPYWILDIFYATYPYVNDIGVWLRRLMQCIKWMGRLEFSFRTGPSFPPARYGSRAGLLTFQHWKSKMPRWHRSEKKKQATKSKNQLQVVNMSNH